jgi:hypothetical protein
LALLPVGLAVPVRLPVPRWALTPPFHPARTCRADCSLWRFPSGCPGRALPGTVASWSPDFPRTLTGPRPSGPPRQDGYALRRAGVNGKARGKPRMGQRRIRGIERPLRPRAETAGGRRAARGRLAQRGIAEGARCVGEGCMRARRGGGPDRQSPAARAAASRSAGRGRLAVGGHVGMRDDARRRDRPARHDTRAKRLERGHLPRGNGDGCRRLRVRSRWTGSSRPPPRPRPGARVPGPHPRGQGRQVVPVLGDEVMGRDLGGRVAEAASAASAVAMRGVVEDDQFRAKPVATLAAVGREVVADFHPRQPPRAARKGRGSQ